MTRRKGALSGAALLSVLGLIAFAWWHYSAPSAPCSAGADPQAMYNRFYVLWSKPAENDERRLREMTRREAAEAWACLIGASEAGGAGGAAASHVLLQFYQEGSRAFGVEPDADLAWHYLRLRDEQRAMLCAAEPQTRGCSGR